MEKSAGIILFKYQREKEKSSTENGMTRRKKGERKYLLLKYAEYKDYWGLCKGRIESGETEIEAALREVQEETGLAGARTSAYTIDPAWAIAVDVTSTDDVFSTPTRALGNGPCITIKDAAMLGSKCINDWLKDISERHNIPLQYDVSEYGATDALTISFSRGGIPATTVSVPVRNIHTVVGMANVNDIKNTIKLLEILLKKPPLVCLV